MKEAPAVTTVQSKILDHFEDDGSLRDIYVFETDASLWVTLAQALAESSFPTRLEVNYTPVEDLEQIPTVVADPDTSGLLVVGPASRAILSHLFSPDEIDFDLGPGDWTEANLEELFEFCTLTAQVTGRNIYVTHEGSPEHCIFLVHDGQIALPERPETTTHYGKTLCAKVRDVIAPFRRGIMRFRRDVPSDAESREAVSHWGSLYHPNDIAWHTDLTAREFRALRGLDIALDLFFGPRTPEECCSISGHEMATLKRHFWDAINSVRGAFTRVRPGTVKRNRCPIPPTRTHRRP